jgi:PST family polysaccharide transporter
MLTGRVHRRTSPTGAGRAQERGRTWQHRLVGTTGVLVWSHIAALAAAFVAVPHLARVLRPTAWGAVLMAQAMAGWLILLVDYALDLSATRMVAEQYAQGPQRHALLVARAQSGRLVLAAGAVLLWMVAVAVIPPLKADWRLSLGALVFALARGLSPMWFFLGIERARGPVLVDAIGRIVAALSVYPFVSVPGHAWRVLAAQAVGATLVLLFLTHRMYRAVPPLPLSFGHGVQMLRAGAALFAARASGAFYSQFNILVVGATASAPVAAMFGGAERLVRALVNLLEPLTRAMVARLTHLRVANVAAADRLTSRMIGLLTAGGSLAAACCMFFAPSIVSVLLGPGYEAAVPVFRRLALLLPVVSLGTALAMFAAVPRGQDRLVLVATGLGGLTNLLLAVPLTSAAGATGMATSVVVAECVVVSVLLTWYLRRSPTDSVPVDTQRVSLHEHTDRGPSTP